MTIKIVKMRSCVRDLSSGNADFYGYATINGKRTGNVWKWKSGGYTFSEDFDKTVHSRENRPYRTPCVKTLNELKSRIAEHYQA